MIQFVHVSVVILQYNSLNCVLKHDTDMSLSKTLDSLHLALNVQSINNLGHCGSKENRQSGFKFTFHFH